MMQRILVALVFASGLLVACGVSKRASTPIVLPTAYVRIDPDTASQVHPGTPTALQVVLYDTATSVTSDVQSTLIPLLPTEVDVTSLPVDTNTPEGPTATANSALLESLLVSAINQERAAHGLPFYQVDAELSAAARAHSCDLAQHSMISHLSSDGRTLAQRLAGNQSAWEWPSESIAAGTADPAAVLAMWMDEPPTGWHRRNILDTAQQNVGVGYCYTQDDPSGNHHYWTADFSRHATT